MKAARPQTIIERVIHFFLHNRLVAILGLGMALVWGLRVMPFEADLAGLPRDPVPVDAIPDIGENQQIVFTDWPGRSPQDVEDQITYPLTVELLGVPGVKTVRSFSFFGFSSVYVVFENDADFYESRTRVLERLASAGKRLPKGVNPVLGPDATPLGQVFWYTLEGEGFSLHELRTIQDWTVRYALQAADGVSEVASVGGFVREYQIDVDPDAMRAAGVKLSDVFRAVKRSNIDVGARTIEMNGVEYLVRGVGFLEDETDLERTVVKADGGVPITLAQLGTVRLGPAMRRGALDKEGAEAVGGVVAVRYGANPLEVIGHVKAKIEEIAPSLPEKVLPDGRISKVQIVPFYDRTQLIHETLDTLQHAISLEILVTLLVVLLMVVHLRASLVVSGLMPLAVGLAFIAMRYTGVDSNIMSLSGIAIAIGTVVDMGIILSENMLRHLRDRPPEQSLSATLFAATSEVSGAVITAIATTVVSFLPVFGMTGSEAKLFTPLAFTKTYVLIASLVIALCLIPPLMHILLKPRLQGRYGLHHLAGLLGLLQLIQAVAWLVWPGNPGLTVLFWCLVAAWAVWIFLRLYKQSFGEFEGRWILAGLVVVAGIAIGAQWSALLGAVLAVYGAYRALEPWIPTPIKRLAPRMLTWTVVAVAWLWLSYAWRPLGYVSSLFANALLVGLLVGSLLGGFRLFIHFYPRMLHFFLRHKALYLALVASIVLFGLTIWLGFDKAFYPVRQGLAAIGISQGTLRSTSVWVTASHAMPGMKKEYMPPLDEGSFLLMPTTMPHASIGEALDILSLQDLAIRNIPEVDTVVGKIGRVDSALDPAPLSMIETVITYKPEYGPPDPETGDRSRLWRDHIRTPDDIWSEIVAAAKMPGVTSAPPLQPIAARIVMLQSGMRAPMGIKVRGQRLEEIERFGLELERLLKQVPQVNPETVNADRIVGKPYLEVHIDREAAGRYGIQVQDVQDVLEVALGGVGLTTLVDGRERYPVRVRYQRELRDSLEAIDRILVAGPDGTQVPLAQLAQIRYQRGPQAIKSEDTALVGYITFDKLKSAGAIETVEAAAAYLKAKEQAGELTRPAGLSYRFAGDYENQIRAEKRLMVLLPLALIVIFLILYLQFKRVARTLLVFSGIALAWSGGFILIWLYGQGWFMNFSVGDQNLRELFNMGPIHLSVAVWVGFLALFGIATDDGVVMMSYLNQTFERNEPQDVTAIREAVVQAGKRRIRACLMTTATTVLALLPVLTSTGRGADVMVPMAIPSFGGMLVALLTLFLVPVGYSLIEEKRLHLNRKPPPSELTPSTL
jgi:Cu(I)/Ag(I) efflux system membrane protein CusA/SilA